ncbi:hypothetical protein ACWD8I_30075 [Micromonospora arida]
MFKEHVGHLVGDVESAAARQVRGVLHDELARSRGHQRRRPEIRTLGGVEGDGAFRAPELCQAVERVHCDPVLAGEFVEAQLVEFGEIEVGLAEVDRPALDLGLGEPLGHGSPVPSRALGGVQLHSRQPAQVAVATALLGRPG